MWHDFLFRPWNKPKAQKQQIIADIYQGLAILSPVSPSIHKHCVDLITVAGHKLVPLAVKLSQNGEKLTDNDDGYLLKWVQTVTEWASRRFWVFFYLFY